MLNRLQCPRDFDVAAVICLAVLPHVVQSIYVSASPLAATSHAHTFEFTHIYLIAQSLQVSLPILLIMKLRNIDWQEYGFATFRPILDSATAMGLVVVTVISDVVVYNLFVGFGLDYETGTEVTEGMVRGMTPAATIGIPLLIASCTANGFAEELALRSYLIPRTLQASGSGAIAVILTSLMFGAYHLYQGPFGAVSAFAMGLVFGAYFLATRRFWAIAIAHALFDILVLLLYYAR